ncbi:MAG: hypothetical protein ABGY96_11900, partial [bacterium]
ASAASALQLIQIIEIINRMLVLLLSCEGTDIDEYSSLGFFSFAAESRIHSTDMNPARSASPDDDCRVPSVAQSALSRIVFRFPLATFYW